MGEGRSLGLCCQARGMKSPRRSLLTLAHQVSTPTKVNNDSANLARTNIFQHPKQQTEQKAQHSQRNDTWGWRNWMNTGTSAGCREMWGWKSTAGLGAHKARSSRLIFNRTYHHSIVLRFKLHLFLKCSFYSQVLWPQFFYELSLPLFFFLFLV